MAVDWLADVHKYDVDANPEVVSGIVRHCGIALQKRDSSLVSFSSPEELKRVREGFLKKKLGRTEADPELDDAILSVGEQMKGDRTKNRVTVYYLLAQKFGQLHLFDRSAPPAASGVAELLAANELGEDKRPNASKAASPISRAGGAAFAVGAGAASAAALHVIDSAGSAAAADRGYGGSTIGAPSSAVPAGPDRLAGEPERGRRLWWLWLILAALAVLLLFALLRSCGHQQSPPSGLQTSNLPATSQTSDNLGAPAPVGGNATAPAPAAPANGQASTATPAGPGIVAETQNGLPGLNVYFDVGKSAVTGDAASASKALRDYVQAHPSVHVGISGYNDPRGNAALNAALSRARAQNVAAALEKAGLPASAIVLEKPANATSASTGAESRRVEVIVRQ